MLQKGNSVESQYHRNAVEFHPLGSSAICFASALFDQRSLTSPRKSPSRSAIR